MPSISTAPESTSYSRGIRYVVVVLPEPDGPDERDELARLRLEVDVLERRTAGRPRAGARRRRPARRRPLDGFHRGDRRRAPPAPRRRRSASGDVVAGRGRRHRPPTGSGTRRRANRTAAAERGRVQRDGIGRVDDLRVHLEVFEDPVEQGQRALDLDLDVEQLAEREEQPALERREGDDRTGGRRRPDRRSRPACRRASTRTPA